MGKVVKIINTTKEIKIKRSGEAGPTGPAGLIWKGAYNSGTIYGIGDAVSYNGSAYICILLSTGNLPTNTTYWNLLAEAGADGLDGSNGLDGADGRGIVSIIRTSGDGSPGTTDTYTINYDKAPFTSTFNVYNGADGTGTVLSVVGGTGINVNSTDPANPDVSLDFGELIEKTTPVDTDIVALEESGGLFKKLTWANIKATLKTYFDTLYVALTGNQNIAGTKTFLSFPVTPSSAPTADYQVANKKYVDDNGGGVVTEEFRVGTVSNTTIGSSATIVIFNSESSTGGNFDNGNNFDTSTYKYTVPSDGLYYIGAMLYVNNGTSGNVIEANIYVDDGSIGVRSSNRQYVSGFNCNFNLNTILELGVGDDVYIAIRHISGTGALVTPGSNFYGYKLK